MVLTTIFIVCFVMAIKILYLPEDVVRMFEDDNFSFMECLANPFKVDEINEEGGTGHLEFDENLRESV